MCSANLKTSFLGWWCLAVMLLAMSCCLTLSAEPMGDDALFEPLSKYQDKSRRDPFVQPQAAMLHNILTRVDIEVLKLTGVVYHSRRSVALFTSQAGPKFGYILRNGKLWRENRQLVPGVTGEVISREQVTLKQGDRRMVFKLR